MQREYPLRLTPLRAMPRARGTADRAQPRRAFSDTAPVIRAAPQRASPAPAGHDITQDVFRPVALPRLSSLKREGSSVPSSSAPAPAPDAAVALRDVPKLLQEASVGDGGKGPAPLRPGTLLQREGSSVQLFAATAAAVRSDADMRSAAAVAFMTADMTGADAMLKRLHTDIERLRGIGGGAAAGAAGSGGDSERERSGAGAAGAQKPRALLSNLKVVSRRCSSAMRAKELSAVESDIAAVLAERAQHDSGAVCATVSAAGDDAAAPVNGSAARAAGSSGDAVSAADVSGKEDAGVHVIDGEEEEEGAVKDGAGDARTFDGHGEEDGEVEPHLPAEEGRKAAEAALARLAASAMSSATAAARAGEKDGPVADAEAGQPDADAAAVGDAMPYDAEPEALAELHSRPWLEEAMRRYTRAPLCAAWAAALAQTRRLQPLRAERTVALPGAAGVALTLGGDPAPAPQLVTGLALCLTERAVRQDRRNIGQVVKEIKVRLPRPWNASPLVHRCLMCSSEQVSCIA